MQLVVTDANIIIDLDAGGLLGEIFRVPELEFCVPDVLYEEELAHKYGALPGLGLKVLSQTGDAVAYVADLKARYRRASINDLFALALARRQGCPLLSGDGALRAAAQAEEVEVHGTLWLVEALYVSGLVTMERVEEAYGRMRRDGSRLPWMEIDAQIGRWRAAAR